MAQAGLLDGKEATTYWRFFNEFAERFPKVLLNQEKHLSDADNLYCAGGVTSACDLYIYLIERYCGASVAQGVARDILYEVQRNYAPGRIGFGGQKLHHDVTILQIQQWLEDHFADKFRFEDVAREHGMSIRNFMRRFQTATGDKPLHYLQRLRIETAKGLLSATRKASKPSVTKWGTTTPAFLPGCFASTRNCRPTSTAASSNTKTAMLKIGR
jgi:transcriptional regulator GlxA family with amidase domain